MPVTVIPSRLSSDIVAKAVPGACFVNAFNELPAGVLAHDPSQDGGRRVVFVASNDDKASATVKALAEQLGFAPIFVGRIDEAGGSCTSRAVGTPQPRRTSAEIESPAMNGDGAVFLPPVDPSGIRP